MSDRLPPVAKWLTRTQDQVLDKFMSLPHACTDGTGQKRFVFVPGTRNDRALIVAHADTVWLNEPIKLGYYRNILFSLDRQRQKDIKYENHTRCKYGIGIGADDRAGCYIAWELRNLGHSILITSGEEQGCISTQYMMNNKSWRKIINGHTFAVQFDRKGYKDVVFYDVGTRTFADYVQQQTGYIPARGTMTDIRYLCRKMCGVNISVGYYDEHFAEEKLVIDHLQNTLQVAKSWLGKKLPFFPLIKEELYEVPHKSYPYGGSHQQSWPTSYNKPKSTNTSGVSLYDPDTEWQQSYKKRHQASQQSDAKEVGDTYISTKEGLRKISSQSNTINDSKSYSNTLVTCKNNDCKIQMIFKVWFEEDFQCPKCRCSIL